MDCVNCGAPLKAKTAVCPYCQTLNDIDLRAIHSGFAKGAQTDRVCPRCGQFMHSVCLRVKDGLYVERCDRCLGIFFDPGELEALLDAAVSHVHQVDYERLGHLIETEGLPLPASSSYAPCPVCRKLMNRKNYGSRSGVVVDRCRNHGVWLDGGELGQLLKWTRAGGQIHDARQKAEEERQAQLKAARKQHESTVAQPVGADPDALDEPVLAGVIGFVLQLLR